MHFFWKGWVMFLWSARKRHEPPQSPSAFFIFKNNCLLGWRLNDIANQLAIHSKTDILYIFSSVYYLVPVFLTLPRSKIWTCNYWICQCKKPCSVWQEKDGQATVLPLWLRHLGSSSDINNNCRGGSVSSHQPYHTVWFLMCMRKGKRNQHNCCLGGVLMLGKRENPCLF